MPTKRWFHAGPISMTSRQYEVQYLPNFGLMKNCTSFMETAKQQAWHKIELFYW